MKVLFIGGTGTISAAISPRAVKKGMQLYLLNRGNRTQFVPAGATVIKGDISDETETKELLKDYQFDVVVDFIAFTKDQLERDFRLFHGKTKQFIFISSASAYQKPLSALKIRESTPLYNPYWEYSRNKAECEEYLMKLYREEGFPVTIVRPSHTYGDLSVPVALHGAHGSFSILERIRTGKKIIVHGDGTSLWTVTHNSDFAKAFVGLIGNSHALGEAYHITSDEALPWNQIYEIIGKALDASPNIVHISTDLLSTLSPSLKGSLWGDKANSVIFDNTKIKEVVPEFICTTRFDEGVRKAVQYIYSHPECQTPDPVFDDWTDTVIEKYENMLEDFPFYLE